MASSILTYNHLYHKSTKQKRQPFPISKNRHKFSYFNKTYIRGDNMIDNEELPIGFTMELAMHADALNKFSRLTKTEQETHVAHAREIESREQMRNYVEQMFR